MAFDVINLSQESKFHLETSTLVFCDNSITNQLMVRYF